MRWFVVAAAGALASCSVGPAPPTQAELQAINSAVKPTSAEAAQTAIKKHFDGALFDAPAALYKFPLPPVAGYRMFGSERQFGWFMCGELNGKNRMGGYTGYRPFLVYFEPSDPGRINDTLVGDTDEYAAKVAATCKNLYGSGWPPVS